MRPLLLACLLAIAVVQQAVAAVVGPPKLVQPRARPAYYFHGHHYPYHHNGRYYSYRYRGHYYNHRTRRAGQWHYY